MGKEKNQIIQPKPDTVIRSAPETPSEEGMAEAVELLRVIAMLVFNTLKSIWMSPADFSDTVERRMSKVGAALETCEEIRLSVRGANLLVNGKAVEEESHHLSVFMDQLTKLDINNFVLKKGLTQVELIMLLDLLTQSPAEIEAKNGFEQAVKDTGLKFVDVRKIVLKEVSESDVVLEKKHVDEEAVERKKEAEEHVYNWLSGGDEDKDAGAHADHVHEISNDPAMMADIIVRVVDRGKEAGGEEASQEKSEVVTGCIENLFSGLMQHSTSKTKTGKKAIKKALKDLEKELMTRLDEESGAEVAGAMHGVVEQLTEGLKVADIAAEYTKKLGQLEKSEKRILRFMKSMALDEEKSAELEAQLKEDGLDVSGWHRLLARSDALSAAEEEEREKDESERAVSQLAYLLGALQEKIEGGSEEEAAAEKTPEGLADELKEANQQVKSMVDETEKKIDELVDAATGDLDSVDQIERAAAKAGRGPRIPRKKLLKNFAEIAQQLCQPLSVIACSVEMISTQRLGEVTDLQMEMLKMAEESAARLSNLVNGLMRMSGLPPELSPDHQLLTQVEGAPEGSAQAAQQ